MFDFQRIHLETYPKITSSPTVKVWFLHLFHMDIFQRVFEPQVPSGNQKLSPWTEKSVGTHQMRARTFARAQITSHIHHEIPFLRYQKSLEDQEWGIIMKKGIYFTIRNTLRFWHIGAHKMVWRRRCAPRCGARLTRHLELLRVRSKSYVSLRGKRNKQFIQKMLFFWENSIFVLFGARWCVHVNFDVKKNWCPPIQAFGGRTQNPKFYK